MSSFTIEMNCYELDTLKEGNPLNIGQLSRMTGASVRSIRHYDKKGLLDAKRLNNGYRDFDETAIDRIQTIQLYLGSAVFTALAASVLSSGSFIGVGAVCAAANVIVFLFVHMMQTRKRKAVVQL